MADLDGGMTSQALHKPLNFYKVPSRLLLLKISRERLSQLRMSGTVCLRPFILSFRHSIHGSGIVSNNIILNAFYCLLKLITASLLIYK